MMCEKLKRVRNLASAALVIIEKKYLDGEKKDKDLKEAIDYQYIGPLALPLYPSTHRGCFG